MPSDLSYKLLKIHQNLSFSQEELVLCWIPEPLPAGAPAVMKTRRKKYEESKS
ncbi:MAG: hypothetical protein OXJ52_09210 [Oligoflexia bacterium]|nr:hypothetical protein [Oligoflexia bacterium]